MPTSGSAGKVQAHLRHSTMVPDVPNGESRHHAALSRERIFRTASNKFKNGEQPGLIRKGHIAITVSRVSETDQRIDTGSAAGQRASGTGSFGCVF
jgi:hypothetical protein